MGSGFALGHARRIVTNRHIVSDKNGQVNDCRLIFEAGTPRERNVTVSAANIRVAPQTQGSDKWARCFHKISSSSGRAKPFRERLHKNAPHHTPFSRA